MDPRRAERVSEALREELAELIGYELKDPRLIGVTVTEVHLTPDGRHARVLVLLPEKTEERGEALAALEHAGHYLRRAVATRLRLFRAPELHFETADAEAGGGRVEELLRRIQKQREKTGKD